MAIVDKISVSMDAQTGHSSHAFDLQSKLYADSEVLKGNHLPVSPQSVIRDELKAAHGKVYIVCADIQSSQCAEKAGSTFNNSSTKKISKIETEIIDTIKKHSNRNSNLDSQNPFNALTLPIYLMRKPGKALEPGNNLYWEKCTQSYERELVRNLSASEGVVTNQRLLKTVLGICGGDVSMSLLTLANFTKNMAAVERRETSVNQSANGFSDVYIPRIIDPLFERIEGLADSSFEKYNKEGALYHLYGAMFAASQWGGIVDGLVHYDNAILASGIFGAENDRIKNAAGLAGARIGEKVRAMSD